MHRSLTVLLPVHNVQSTLAARVVEAVEMAADLAERFEVVIVDDGSTDDTCEVAFELARDYPQVQAVRHGRRLGRDAAVRNGFLRSHGEVVLVADEEETAPGGPDGRAGSTRTEGPAPAGTTPRCPAGYEVLDRGMLERRGARSRPAAPNYLAKRARAATPHTATPHHAGD